METVERSLSTVPQALCPGARRAILCPEPGASACAPTGLQRFVLLSVSPILLRLFMAMSTRAEPTEAFFNGRFIIGNDYVRMYVTLVDSSWVVVASVLTGVDFIPLKFADYRVALHSG